MYPRFFALLSALALALIWPVGAEAGRPGAHRPHLAIPDRMCALPQTPLGTTLLRNRNIMARSGGTKVIGYYVSCEDADRLTKGIQSPLTHYVEVIIGMSDYINPGQIPRAQQIARIKPRVEIFNSPQTLADMIGSALGAKAQSIETQSEKPLQSADEDTNGLYVFNQIAINMTDGSRKTGAALFSFTSMADTPLMVFFYDEPAQPDSSTRLPAEAKAYLAKLEALNAPSPAPAMAPHE